MKHYEGMGDVAFIMRGTDGLWVRANKPGVSVLLDYFTNREEPGAFTYRVIHENGVVVRTAPGLDAPPVKVRFTSCRLFCPSSYLIEQAGATTLNCSMVYSRAQAFYRRTMVRRLCLGWDAFWFRSGCDMRRHNRADIILTAPTCPSL